MASNLEHLDRVWHPEHGIMLVLEPPEEVLENHGAVQAGLVELDSFHGVWAVPQSAEVYLDLVTGSLYVDVHSLLWFEAHELARVGMG